jgi:predicted glycosyltransferase
MKIIIDINHPTHVHCFRDFYKIMFKKGHEILFVSRNKEIEHRLISSYGIPFIYRGKGKDGKIGKILYMIYANFKLFKIARKFNPDLFLNFLHPYPSWVASFLNKPSLVFSDTEHAAIHHKLKVPFAIKVFTPACYRLDLGKKHFRFELLKNPDLEKGSKSKREKLLSEKLDTTQFMMREVEKMGSVEKYSINF